MPHGETILVIDDKAARHRMEPPQQLTQDSVKLLVVLAALDYMDAFMEDDQDRIISPFVHSLNGNADGKKDTAVLLVVKTAYTIIEAVPALLILLPVEVKRIQATVH